MKILLVTVIMAVLVSLISDLEKVEVFSTSFKFRQIRAAELDVQMRTALQIIRQAYDNGQQAASSGGSCPSDTSLISGIPFLCWPTDNLNSNNCFTHSTENSNERPMVCLASNQSAFLRQTHFSNLASLSWQLLNHLSPQKAFAITPGKYTNIEDNLLQSHPQANANKASVYVSKPIIDNPANEVNSNFISCDAAHTDCFSIILCTNGNNTCSGSNRVIQTFAVRVF